VPDAEDALDLVAALADSQRIAVAAAVVLGNHTTDAVVAATGLPKRQVLAALTRLDASGLAQPDEVGDVDGESASVLRTFLRAFHPDTAALRRYLVDEGFLTREHNVYWRTGGAVDV
jgi:ATP phosphoribosyltransferase regulatory subunit HisZ